MGDLLMRALAIAALTLACVPESSAASCGECDVGKLMGEQCVMPTMSVSPTDGLPSAPTGGRAIFDPESYSGSDTSKVTAALAAAQAVGGAVVLSRVYDLEATLYVSAPVMVTGGGLRRACTPVATVTAAAAVGDTCIEVDDASGFVPGNYVLALGGPAEADHITNLGVGAGTGGTQYCSTAPLSDALPIGTVLVRNTILLQVLSGVSGVVVDSVFFDGANRCNGYTHAWQYNTTAFANDATVRNSVFYDVPSENLFSCGATVLDNEAFALQGSFVHKSCPAPGKLDIIAGNYVDGVNLATHAVVGHSEGAITLSANAGHIAAAGNVFRNGAEGVFGLAGPDDEGIVSGGGCFAHFDEMITLYAGANPDRFQFSSQTIDVPVIKASQ